MTEKIMRIIRWTLMVCASALLWTGCCSKNAATLDAQAAPTAFVPPVEYLVWNYVPTEAGTDYITAWIAEVEGVPQVLNRRSGVWIAVDNAAGSSSFWQASVEPTGEAKKLDYDCMRAVEKNYDRLRRYPPDDALLPCLTVRTRVPQLYFRNRDTHEEVIIPTAYEARDTSHGPALFREYQETITIVGTAGTTVFATRCVAQDVWGSAHDSSDCEAILFDAATGTRQDVRAWAGEWLASDALRALRAEGFDAMHAAETHDCIRDYPETAESMSLAMLWPDLLSDSMRMNYRFLTEGPYVCSAYGWGSYTLAFDIRSDVLPPNIPKDHVQTPPLVQEYMKRFDDNIARGWSPIRFGTDVPRQFIYR